MKLEHVRDHAMDQWLTINQKEKLSLSRVHFYSRNDLENIPSLMTFLLSIIHKHSTGDVGANIIRYSSPADRHLKSVSFVSNIKMTPIENWFGLEQQHRHSTISRVISELSLSSTLTMKIHIQIFKKNTFNQAQILYKKVR